MQEGILMAIVLGFKYRELPRWRLPYIASEEDGVVRWLLWEMMGRKLKMSQSVRFWGVWHPAELVWHPPKFDTLPNGTPLPNVVSRHPSLETKFTQASSSTSSPMSLSTLITLHDRISRSIIRGRWGVWHIWVSSSTRTLKLLRFVLMPALCSTGVLCVGHMIKTPQNYEMKGDFPQAIVV